MKFIIMFTLGALLISHTAYGKSRAASCKNFNTQAEAQKYFKAGKRGWKRLDGDKDGEACECLLGGSSYGKNICVRWRKKNGKR